MEPTSTVTVSGDTLTNGNKNITKIVVTAQNGSVRTYKIYSVREKADSSVDIGNSGKNLTVLMWVGFGLAAVLIAAVITVIILKKKRKKA